MHGSDDVSRLDLAKLVSDLADDLVTASGRTDIALTLRLDLIPVQVDKAAASALLFIETITNALKHAFVDRAGQLTISVSRDGKWVTAVNTDDGMGVANTDPARRSFGCDLIEMLTVQLSADRAVSANAPAGTRMVFRIPAMPILVT